MSSSDPIEQHGIVGAGGAGFPTSVKLRTPAQLVIVNAAECEPLLHKDKELIAHYARELGVGLRVAMQRVGAAAAVIGIKSSYAEVIEPVRAHLPEQVRVEPLRDTYPAGDEFVLVYDVTGKVIPPGGLPRDLGVVVLNVETLVNIGLDRPVTHKALTIAGAVRRPVTVRVPVGSAIGELLQSAGGASVDEYAVLVGGVMMGRLATGLQEPVTKTTGGLVVLPTTHPLIRRYQAGWSTVRKVGKSACDQCRFCTELCPRYLLGHPIQPHLAMRALGFAGQQDAPLVSSLYCCECNLCTLYACPEGLDPMSVCAHAKLQARQRDVSLPSRADQVRPHPLAAFRRVPTGRLMRRLGLRQYVNVGPLVGSGWSPRRVVLPLKQHAGAPAEAVVRIGQRVTAGEVLAIPAEGALGARIHASIDGAVTQVAESVVLEA